MSLTVLLDLIRCHKKAAKVRTLNDQQSFNSKIFLKKY
jgi:hypothetical protein